MYDLWFRQMANEAPETIASFARNRLRARLKCRWSYVREEREVFKFGMTLATLLRHRYIRSNDLKHNLTEVRLLKMVNEAPETMASFARNWLSARL